MAVHKKNADDYKFFEFIQVGYARDLTPMSIGNHIG